MKTLFTIIFLTLVAASFITWRSLPDASSDAPVLYWVTDANPARVEQIRTFRQWLRENNHPDIEVRVDTVNMSPEKVLVQGVSGVAGDLIDHTGGSNMRFRQAVGLLADVTEDAKRMGFDLSKTFAVLEDELSVNGRQYSFPSNVTCDALWVNVEAFERLGMEPPPRRWTAEEFEAIGKEFVKRANEPGKMRRYFFMPGLDTSALARTLGGAIYNETQSACIIDGPGYCRALELTHKWTYEDRLLPSTSEKGAFSSMAGYGGSSFALFEKGNYALVRSGRHALIQFRKFSDERRESGQPPMKLAVSEDPYGEHPLSYAQTRATAVYAAGKNKEYAKYFMAYLASEAYNMNIVVDADALPPNPAYTKTEAFLQPQDRPEEWQHPWGSVHGAYADIMEELGVPLEFSPFVLDAVANRVISETTDKFMNNMLSAQEATVLMQKLINDELRRSLLEDPSMLPLYEERLARQKEIDRLKANSEKIPLSWITNPYWRRWHALNNLVDETR